MRYAIWGSKQRARRLAICLDDEVSFFIDSNPLSGGWIGEKPIYHPDDIHNWDELFVYVPQNFYEEIVPVLIGKGLTEGSDFAPYPLEIAIGIDFQKVLKHLEQSKQEFQQYHAPCENMTFFFSVNLTQCHPYMAFVAKMIAQKLPIGIVSENYSCIVDALREESQSGMVFFGMKPMMDSNLFILNGQISAEEAKSIVDAPILFNAMLHHRLFTGREAASDFSKDASVCMIFAMKKYAEMFVKYIRPAMVVLHGSSISFHKVFAHICGLHGIPVWFTHEGVIPGTFVIEPKGEMGHSLPAMYPDRFSSLPVSDAEVSHTQKVWDYLYESKLNRKVQPQNDCLEYIHTRIQKDRPTIFFAGQNDIGSHMVPYTEITQKYHSPIFRSSLEAAIYLAEICEKNGWNFIYKPHPDYVKPEQVEQLPKNTIFIAKGDINSLIDVADVTVTILSTTNYNALIRHKPVVMLGYNQTKGKGCTYEAFEKDKIEDAIKAALENGFTQEQQDAFLLHMAQCLKYYLYDDLQERPIRYGRPVPKSIDEFYELERLLKM